MARQLTPSNRTAARIEQVNMADGESESTPQSGLSDEEFVKELISIGPDGWRLDHLIELEHRESDGFNLVEYDPELAKRCRALVEDINVAIERAVRMPAEALCARVQRVSSVVGASASGFPSESRPGFRVQRWPESAADQLRERVLAPIDALTRSVVVGDAMTSSVDAWKDAVIGPTDRKLQLSDVSIGLEPAASQRVELARIVALVEAQVDAVEYGARLQAAAVDSASRSSSRWARRQLITAIVSIVVGTIIGAVAVLLAGADRAPSVPTTTTATSGSTAITNDREPP